MSFIFALLRVLIGFVMACLFASFIQVLFAVPPAELAQAGSERLVEATIWGLKSAAVIGAFSAPFAFIATVVSEWMALRSFAYFALVSMAIAVGGFGLLYAGESATEASIVNSYAMAAFLTSGFVGGVAYWLFAGRWAGRPRATVRMESDRKPEPDTLSRDGARGTSAPTTVPATNPAPTVGVPKAGGGASA